MERQGSRETPDIATERGIQQLMQPKILVSIQFFNGRVEYSGEFKIKVIGEIYPRQLRAACDMIDIFKQCTREDGEREKDRP